jgi:hypothetical protein
MKSFKLFYKLFLSALIVIPNLLFAQFLQQGPKLSGTGAIGNSEQGHSVSVSADGNTAILGAPTDNGGIGAAWIFIRSGGTWTQQGVKLVGSGNVGNSNQGASVSVSADGNTAIIGGYGDNGTIGAAWIFIRSGGTWTQQGQKLVGTGYTGTPRQGSAVSISGDGNTVIIGGPTDSTNKGGVWVFIRSGSVWTQQGQRFRGSGGVGNPSFGNSVSISADGNTALIGGPSDINGIYQVGAAWIFTRSGGAWIQQGPKLVGTGNIGHSFQGYGVSISSDGNTAIVGGYYDNDLMGAAWIFTRGSGTWTQQGPKLVGTGNVGGNVFEGFSVSISGDGNTAIIGGYGDVSVGAAWVFTRRGTIWSQLGPKIVGAGSVGAPQEGIAVAISANGNTVLVGGNTDNNNAGAAWVFVRSNFRFVNSRYNLHKPILGNQSTFDTTTLYTNILSYFISNLTVTLDTIRYVNLSDLEITISQYYNFDAQSVYTDTLVYQVGGSGANFIGTVLSDSASIPISNGTPPFTGTFRPSKPLSLFHNLDPSGNWVLTVYDRATGRTGTLDAWTLTIDLVTNPISVKNISQEVPKGFHLMQNYPNPFNPNTKFEFQIVKSGVVNVTVFDILGKEVETLVNEQLQPGTYKVDFDGSKLSSGVYFYKLETGDFAATKKMLLVK